MPFFPVTTMSMAAISGFASILFLFDWDDPIGVRNYNPPLSEEYDYIIIGAGASGSVVASRLSEDKDVSVLLLEAGSDGSYFTSVPALQGLFYGGPFDWQFEPEEQLYSCLGYDKRVCKWIRGKALGGSTVLNGGVYMRGLKKDFDNWANMGNPGWSYEDVLPFFKKSENNLEEDFSANTRYHNTGGPLKVSRQRFRTKAGEAWLQTGLENGYPVDDLNGDFQRGFMSPQVTLDEYSRRESAATAFLEPARTRANLHISPNSQVTRMIVDDVDRRATGVEYLDVRRRSTRTVRARREIILSAGAVNTPKLLMLSGIGPTEELAKHGIPQMADLPVGENLHGHSGVFGVSFTTERQSGFNVVRDMFANAFAPLQFYFTGRGPFAGLTGLEGVGLLPREDSQEYDWPDLGFVFFSFTPSTDGGIARRALGISEEAYGAYRDIQFTDGFTIVPYVPRPVSRGKIKLRSADPFVPPIIISNALKERPDVELLAEGALEAMRLGTSQSFRAIGAKFYPSVLPACHAHEAFSKSYWMCHARQLTFNMFHDVGTAKMGAPSDPSSVVDPELRVYGVKGLRVMDASVMPQVVSTNTGAACMMIGEKGAAIIRHYAKTGRSDWPVKPAFRRQFNVNITSIAPTEATTAYTFTTPSGWRDTRNSTEYPTTQELLGLTDDNLHPVYPETTPRSENEIDVDVFHTFQSNWKLQDEKRSTRFSDMTTETTTNVAQEEEEDPQEFSTEEPKPFYHGDKKQTVPPTTPLPMDVDEWTVRVETAAPIMMSLSVVGDVTTPRNDPSTDNDSNLTPPVPHSQVSAFIAAQPALTLMPDPEPTTTTPKAPEPTTMPTYDDEILPSLDKVDNDLELIPVLPEISWNPNSAFWYPEKHSQVERHRRSRLLTYRH